MTNFEVKKSFVIGIVGIIILTMLSGCAHDCASGSGKGAKCQEKKNNEKLCFYGGEKYGHWATCRES
jgi:hypothetical protein